MKETRPAPLADLPDFLHNSPYLPTFNPPADDYVPTPQPKPSILDILKSKPARVAIFTSICLATFLYYRSSIHEYHAWTRLTGPSCSLTKPSYPPPSWDSSDVDWSRFAYTQYVTNLDYLCNSSMDDLFFLPPATAAMPRAWWLDYPFLSSHIMLIQPSAYEFSRVEDAIKEARLGVYDMEIVNKLYGRDCVVLPHRRYALLTGEFRAVDHSKWLEAGSEVWDPEEVRREANFVHFSDDPLPKPWLAEEKKIRLYEPDCADTKCRIFVESKLGGCRAI
ncbi:hypothetical protein BUE80_DR007474 [Diplocarpon rosae]|nr:hypothetical protein BUE80_DR007474 [Diplocarpon rosae]